MRVAAAAARRARRATREVGRCDDVGGRRTAGGGTRRSTTASMAQRLEETRCVARAGRRTLVVGDLRHGAGRQAADGRAALGPRTHAGCRRDDGALC